MGVHLLLLNIVALASYARKPWLKVGVRVLGSWSAASALLVPQALAWKIHEALAGADQAVGIM